ncbi:transaldolase family protein [Vibrio viridaestus]|uniref:Fructose-6-phosphate aldolase n=1 Tax=Vibrio viridaestus TaxID=2487322 RepID=A0A3N9TF88_9VIBR|nr:transaldolase family protein [Vibrio viridaestus]RQW62789.1 fructose-6-phosphate aldolase [Vibrio viridaestus]
MSIYLDTSDVNQIKTLSDLLPISGVTTNPTIVAKSGEKMTVLLPKIREALGGNGLIFGQVLSQNCDEMVEEALRLNQMADNFVVKVPVTMQGVKAIKVLKKEGITTLGTAIYTSQQAIIAALAGASFVAPYFNRIDMLSGNAIETVKSISLLLSNHAQSCQVLGASFKNTKQVIDCLSVGNSSVTIPVDIAYQMMTNSCVDEAIDQFQQDWTECFGSLSLEV